MHRADLDCCSNSLRASSEKANATRHTQRSSAILPGFLLGRYEKVRGDAQKRTGALRDVLLEPKIVAAIATTRSQHQACTVMIQTD